MRGVLRTLFYSAVFTSTFLTCFFLGGADVATSAAPGAPADTMLVGFGGAVLVGDGEVFVGEAANQFRPGTVYVYRKTGNAWQQAATLNGPNAAVGDQFGTALALDGARLFVGAGPGAVHVFGKQGTTWSLTGSLAITSIPGAIALPAPNTPPPSDPAAAAALQNAERFGTAVAATGEWLFVGKAVPGGGRGRIGGGGGGAGRGGENAPAVPAGSVYVFKRDAAGQYAYNSTLKSGDAASAGDGFGSAIATLATTVLIGARGQSSQAGVVFEYGLDAADGTWKSQRSFAPLGIQAGEGFGSAIAASGDQAIVAAPGDAGGYGAVYAFRKVAQAAGRRGGGGGQAGAAPVAAPQAGGGNFTWQEAGRLTSPAGVRLDRFAAALAADDKEVWVGAPGAAGPGRVFVFPGNATGFRLDGLQVLGPNREEPAAAGQSISLRGNVAAVGATGVNRSGGGLLIYERDANGAWREQSLLTPALDELPAFTGADRRCSGAGKVEMFECGAADLQAFLPPSKLSHDGHYIQLSSLWGWTDSKTKKEWAIIGRRDGATFVDITNPNRPIVVADLPLTEGARPSSWREMKVYRDTAYIVSDGSGPHGIQVVDLGRLRTMTPQPNGLPQKIDADYIYREVNSVHDIVINEDSGFLYAVGSSAGGTTCGGGLHMMDVKTDPLKPRFVGCYADAQTGRSKTGYSHDAQCVTYKGPDKRYKGREICIGSNENHISLADVTDKANPKFVSRATYPKVAYTHQGWLDEQHRWFYVNDELDEGRDGIDKTRTLVWDLVDLENPKLVKEHMGTTAASDHNLFVKGDLMYQANYRAGLRILSIRDRANPKEVAYFDTAPYHPNTPGFNGAWHVYPFFKSGSIIVSSIEQGFFIVKTADK
jgi:choice-of-anchor B domain-containing protein